MGQISSKFEIEEEKIGKTLPSSFDKKGQEITFKKAITISTALHAIAPIIAWSLSIVLALLGIKFLAFDKPHMAQRDIEFVLVNKKEAPPINKNTKLRSDRNSRAGGIHDPKRKISEPSPNPGKVKSRKVASAPAPKKVVAKGGGAPKAPVKPTKPQQNVAQAPAKPIPMQPPRPAAPLVGKSGPDMPMAQMPKLSQNPKSPFSVGVPKTTQPTGTAYSTGNGTSKYGGGAGGVAGGSGLGSGTNSLSPQFSKGTGTGSGYGTGRGTGYGTGRGTGGGGGYGNYGNPSPGNPSGAPGVDAIRQPDWGPYMRNLENRIRRNWNPPKGDTSKRVVMYFKISRDGKLISISIAKSSGTPLADQAAKAAIEQSAPFPPLPPEYRGSNIDIDFTFDYNVLGARYR